MNKEKKCRQCGAIKSLSDFYKCRGMADGHFNQCKSCRKIYADNYAEKNAEMILAKSRARKKSPERLKLDYELTKAWKATDARIQKCHNAVRTEIRAGRITRKPCESCGNEKSHAHHEDYDKPLEITWLCPVCHKKRHKELLHGTKHINQPI